MHFTLELTQVEDSLGVVLPDEVLAALKPRGDSVYLVQSQDGFRLTSANPLDELPDQTVAPVR